MILPFTELKNIPFSVSGFSALLQKPSYRTLDHRASGRRCSGFILVKSGACRFSYGEEVLCAEVGDVVYLPLGCRHILTLSGDDVAFYRVDFLLHTASGAPLFFSEHPLLLARGVPEAFYRRVSALCENPQDHRDSLFVTEQLAHLLRACAENTRSGERKRLQAAVRELHKNFSEVPSVRELAALSCLSESRFYELFKSEYGKTPLEYRNALLLDRARALLLEGDVSVCEVAAALGFADPAYFSRFFKKHTHLSPKDVRPTDA